MKKFLITFIILIFSKCSLYSQNKIIYGRVISDNLDILIGVHIFINDTVEAGRTDLNGFFHIEIPDSVKKLSFRDVGLEETAIELLGKCEEVEVVMMLSCTCDFMTPRQVDRYRRKKFKKVQGLHKEAFEKGLFKTDTTCYRQSFISSSIR